MSSWIQWLQKAEAHVRENDHHAEVTYQMEMVDPPDLKAVD